MRGMYTDIPDTNYVPREYSVAAILLLLFMVLISFLSVLNLLLSSSSSSPLCRVFILIFLRQTMSLGNTVLQLFCCYYSWCLYRQFQCRIFYYYYYYYHHHHRISHFSGLGNIHLSWDVVINRIRLSGLICSLKSFLQLNMCQELQIFAVVYMYSGAG